MDQQEYQDRMIFERWKWSRDQHKGDWDARRAFHHEMWLSWARMIQPSYVDAIVASGLPVLVIGCNHGGVEWDVAELLPGVEIDAVDLMVPDHDPEGWALTIERFGDRVKYYPGTDAQVSLPRERYAAIFAAAVIHHFPHLEQAADMYLERLMPGGFFFVSEYVGAKGISATEQRYRVADAIWAALPEEYKTRNRDGRIQERVFRRPPEKAGGFESICSDRIVPALTERFDVLTERFSRPLFGYRCIVWGDGPKRLNPYVDRLTDAFERILMDEGWLQGEDWVAVLQKPRGET